MSVKVERESCDPRRIKVRKRRLTDTRRWGRGQEGDQAEVRASP